ncbi:MFS transporter [Bacillaceae bacterium SIJ1]|uniref:MFS transporter n=1 Tax=Litoribacterium kuwaitense TaxID=1398745 RepID=UPI0013E9C602|nr:MFS transporter [Litoribacterium kuwaitense]NGP43552.1 MFS transporter [Litoribacterium kuwaitense]
MNFLMKKLNPGSEKTLRALLLLIAIGGLYALSIALSNTFVNVYLWKQSGDYASIAIYNLATVIWQPITFIIAGRWAKRVDRVLVLRIGVIFLAFFYLTVLLIGEQSSDHLVLLGSLLGIGFGFYWLAFNVLTFEITEPDTRDFFNGFLGFLSSFTGIIGPISAGFIISRMEEFTGYTTIFTASLLLFAAAVALSFFLSPRPAKGSYEWKRIFKERSYNSDWKRILHAHFFQGFREGTFAFAITIWVFIATGSELAIGTFSLVNSSIALLFYFIAARFIAPSYRKETILYASLAMYASVLCLMFSIQFPLLLTYAVITAVAYPLLTVPFASLTYDVIGRGWRAADMRVEYVVVKELYLNAGRIVSILLFIGVVLSPYVDIGLPILIAVIGAGHLLMYLAIRHLYHPPPPRKDEEERYRGNAWVFQQNKSGPR